MLLQLLREPVPTLNCWLANSEGWQWGGGREESWFELRVCGVQVGWFATQALRGALAFSEAV